MFFIKYIVNYLKKYYKIDRGTEFVDALRRINRPSEVTVPSELIPAGVLMQLRGLFNLHALSVNNDWIWPYWIEQQYNPKSSSFIPRAMSLTYINLTHRNWTAVGVLGGTREAVVDPRSAVTPWLHGWSLDTWVNVDGHFCFPSRLPENAVEQRLIGNLPMVSTQFMAGGATADIQTWAFRWDEHDYVVVEARLTNPGDSPLPLELIFSIRPYNPEGLSLVKNLTYNTRGFWTIDGSLAAYFPDRPGRSIAADHRIGDVSLHLHGQLDETAVHCDVGLATGASIYTLSLAPGQTMIRYVVMPIEPLGPRFFQPSLFSADFLAKRREEATSQWREKLDAGMQLDLPDRRYQDSFEANKAFLLLLNDGQEITAGPFTYHRHWFRDAAYLLNALGKMGYCDDAARILRFYPLRQWKNGYFCSQKGEWDSNGEAIWSIMEHYRLTGDEDFLREMYPSIRRGVIWIEKKRHDISFSRLKPRGLLPAGFSAEHLGPNDYYYWDNFWCLCAVRDAMLAAEVLRNARDYMQFESIYSSYLRDVQESINRDLEHSDAHVLPAAPNRRPDAGMIGNVAAAYPLKLFPLEDTPWLRNTVTFIRDHLFHDDGFYQQMIHSGVNSYLTMQMAQCLLFMGDLSAYRLSDYMLRLATPTWCWPEAINPQTFGGCMGDGHHGWAAAEWLLLMRNLVVHVQGDVLQITRLLPAEWCKPGQRIAIRNAPTYLGTVSACVEFGDGSETLTLDCQWRTPPRHIQWFLPAHGRRVVTPQDKVTIEGEVALLAPDVCEVRLEVDLEHAHSITEGAVPGLDELPQHDPPT